MTPEQFRKAALAFPEATEGAHMAHPDFRVGGKIFATLGYPDAEHAVVMLTPEDQKYFVHAHGAAFAPVRGSWGRSGSTAIELSAADVTVVGAALEAAWRRRAPKRLLRDES